MNTELHKLYVVEWNESEKDISIRSVNQMLAANLRNAKSQHNAGYVPLFISESSDEANEFAFRMQSGELINVCSAQGIAHGSGIV